VTTIPIEAEVSTEQLLRAVEQLPPQEFSAFIAQLLALRARREGPYVGQSETALLLQINEGLPTDVQGRFDQLVAKRQEETIAPEELDELKALTDRVEQHGVRRLAALDALARLRQVPLADLMDGLGITPPAYA